MTRDGGYFICQDPSLTTRYSVFKDHLCPLYRQGCSITESHFAVKGFFKILVRMLFSVLVARAIGAPKIGPTSVMSRLFLSILQTKTNWQLFACAAPSLHQQKTTTDTRPASFAGSRARDQSPKALLVGAIAHVIGLGPFEHENQAWIKVYIRVFSSFGSKPGKNLVEAIGLASSLHYSPASPTIEE